LEKLQDSATLHWGQEVAPIARVRAHNWHVNVRKLAAIDLFFLGQRLILAEFGIGVFGSLTLGVMSAWQVTHRFHSVWMVLFGVYLVFVGINYVPLLLHAIDISRRGSAQREIADELGSKQKTFRKYRRQSLWLFVPLVVPVAAILPTKTNPTFGVRPGSMSCNWLLTSTMASRLFKHDSLSFRQI